MGCELDMGFLLKLKFNLKCDLGFFFFCWVDCGHWWHANAKWGLLKRNDIILRRKREGEEFEAYVGVLPPKRPFSIP